MKPSAKDYKRIVVKIGSSLLYAQDKKLDLSFILEITRQISNFIKEKKEVVLVSSGAIAFGMSVLGIDTRPKDLSYLQAVAAIGQNELMNTYRKLFKKSATICAQVLLTWEDFADRRRYLNAKNTLLKLLKLGSIPVINENDTVSTDEIKFGDNDRLSALVASLISADLLIILSDVDGVLDSNNKVLRVVDEISLEIKELARPTVKQTCMGGMITKIEAAKIAVDSGISCIIANGRRKDILLSAVKEPYSSGTLFIPKKGNLSAKERWIAFGTKPKGKVIVDDGAKRALVNKKSLLCVGVINIEGNFEAGDIVSIIDKEDNEFARGKAGISARQLERVLGLRFEKEVVHCDNIVLL